MNLHFSTLLVLILAFAIKDSTTLIFDGPVKCAADPPCFCQGDEINCEQFNLSTFPSLKVTQIPNGHFAVNVANNLLTSIPVDAFISLKPSQLTEFDIFLPGNQLTSIAPGAFNGIAERLFDLYIDENDFTEIPSELAKLTNLRELAIEHNPITSLSSSQSTLTSLGQHMKTFAISLSEFTTWPTELNSLTALQSLALTDVYITIPQDAFTTLESHLTSLSIADSGLTQVPYAARRLSNLQALDLEGNNITKIDDSTFSALTSLVGLSLSDNPLISISDNIFKANVNLETLYLQETDLKILPVSITGLHYLSELYLDQSPTVCNCGLNYLKGWDVSHVTISGYCQPGPMSVKTFLTNELATCP